MASEQTGMTNTPPSAEIRARNFELMLNRIVYRYRHGLDITATIEQARDLLSRTGTGILQREAINGE